MPTDSNVRAENSNVQPTDTKTFYEDAYGTDDEGIADAKYAQDEIRKINDALVLRERNSLVTNGIPYSRAYLYNQQKAINYAPPRDPKDDRQVSVGIVHEKIIAFISIFLRYEFRRRIRAYSKDGKLIEGLGDFYDLGIEHTQRMERFAKKIALMYWEVYSQGNAFMFDDWDVRNCTEIVAKAADGTVVSADTMDFTYEFIEGLKYEDGPVYQERMASWRVLDGRMVIFDNPEIVEVQENIVTIEEEISRSDAEKLYGTLKRWAKVPKDRKSVDLITPEHVTLFGQARLAKPDTTCIVHRRFDPKNNRFNLYINGLMMFSRKVPLSIFYPRAHIPLANVAAERLTGSVYARAIPAKVKFTADFIDWALKNLALKFEQGVVPAILAKGKYTLSRDMFRAGQVTHGVQKSDYEKADPDNKGVTPAEFSFFNLLKDIVEAQTLNPTTLGELQPGASATEINVTDQNQREKLGFLLDGLVSGFIEMSLIRAETIESKYTKIKKKTFVDGKEVPVYENFTININGVDHNVVFDDQIGDPTYNHEQARSDLHKQAFQAKKKGKPSEFYAVNPKRVREDQPRLEVEIIPERIKETGIRMEEMWGEFTQLLNTFGPNVNMEELKSIYLETRGRPASIFNSADSMKLQQITAQGTGSFGTPGATEGQFAPKAPAPMGGGTAGRNARPALLGK